MRIPEPFVLPELPTTATDLAALGVSRRRLATVAHAGRLLRVRRGVYLDPGHWPEDPRERHLLRARAEQAYQPEAVVSHRSAAAHWGIAIGQPDWADEPVWLTLPPGLGFRSERSADVVRFVGPLPSHQTTRADGGLLLTTVARTAADLARGVDLPEALAVLDASLRLLCAELVAQPRRVDFANPRLAAAARVPIAEAMQRRGMASARVALGMADPVRESPIESVTYAHLVRSGLPLPICQHPLQTPLGLLFPDFYWPEHQLIGEADGKVKYTGPDAIIAEKEREQLLRDLGYRIVRWTGREIYGRPQEVLARIARALGV